MERAILPDWAKSFFKKHPDMRPAYDDLKERLENKKAPLWMQCKAGEILPVKIYMPPPKVEGARCELCGDIGWRHYWQNGQEFAEECECYNKVQSERNLKKAGVNQNQTFDTWCSDFDYQIEMSKKAYEFALGGYLSGQWFFAGGQVGSGKTHICTAIVHELIKSNIGCRYMAWRDEAVQLKAIVNNHQEYHARLMQLCKAPVLYIDDLFKTQAGMKPTQADVNLAFQIINFRYNDKRYTTIISCEHTIDGLNAIDEAIGSRIYERSKGYRCEIEKDENKNYRMRGE